MIGMTPAELTRRGTKLFCPSRIRPRPTTFRGICTGIFRAPIVINTTAAVIPTSTTTRPTRAKIVICPAVNDSHVRPTAAGKPSMMEKKIRSDIPLPIPCSVICSPSHITKIAPTVSVMVVVRLKTNPGSRTAPVLLRKAA